MGKYIKCIREKTSGMKGSEKLNYILTYYWYHLLGIGAAVCLLLLFGGHYLSGNERPLFYCAAVNVNTDDDRDDAVAAAFAAWAGLDEERIKIDSNYNFSYGDVALVGANESYYEKFFIKWQNQELDAVILEESFYKFCREMGGTFRSLSGMELGNLVPYEEDGDITAVVLECAGLFTPVRGECGEPLLLAFLDDGMHEEACGAFLSYIGTAG